MRKIIGLGVLLTAAAIIYLTFRSTENVDDYLAEIQKQREEKDHFMRSSDSPFSDDSLGFVGLSYFPIDPKYKIQANLSSIPDRKVVVLPTSDGAEKKYLEYGYAEFEWEGTQNRLLILEIMDQGPYRGTLFLAFGDETSARETYGAGRYLDVKKIPGSTAITLDFNQAYNPYCAYNDQFSCPLPPPENLLIIPIRAGEKIYSK